MKAHSMTASVTQTTNNNNNNNNATTTMKINHQEQDIASTIHGLKWLSVRNSLWDDSEPLVNNSSHSSLNFSGGSRFESSPGSLSPKRRLRSPLHHVSEDEKMAYEYKNAEKILHGSISAVINFLGTAGVPKPACDQLQKNLSLQRYFAVLKRVQDYIQCIPTKSEDETLAKIHLAVSAWEALCKLKAVEYKRAYKHCSKLRHHHQENNSGGGLTSPKSIAVVGSSKNHHHHHHQQSVEVKQAIALQVKIAEQCTACQKKLYLVQKWQKHLLQQMKRQSTIEPQGYAPIRCL